MEAATLQTPKGRLFPASSIGGPMKKQENARALPVGALKNFSAGLIELAEQAPERMTVGQLAFFLLAGAADAAGRPATFTEIKEAVGETINRSLHTTYKIFLDRPQRRSDTTSTRQGLGWLTREEDRADNRRKFLRLTPKGRAVLNSLILTVGGK